MRLSFREFVRLGREQYYTQANPLARAFLRWLGPIGLHARIRNARVLGMLDDADLVGKQVLDIGCGHGYSLFFLARRFPTAVLRGIDIDARQIAGCNVAVLVEDFTNLVFDTGVYTDLPEQSAYDLIVTIDTLEHVEDDIGMLRRMFAALQPGGIAVIHVPLRHQLQRRIFLTYREHTVGDHVRDEYLPTEIWAKVRDAGFEIERRTFSFGLWGELAFELNNLFSKNRSLRALTALATLPIALVAGYVDSQQSLLIGNAIVMRARRPLA